MENRIKLGLLSSYSLDLDHMEIVENVGQKKLAKLGAQPIFTIAGTDFYVEVYSQTLIEVGNPRNYLPIKDMSDMGDYYEFPYHLRAKDWPCELDDPNDSITVQVPQLVVLDPEGMAQKYSIDISEIRGRKDIELLNPNYEGFLARISGELPQIDIAGDIYIIDLDMKELRLVQDSNRRLMISDFETGSPLEDDFSYRFLYETKLRHVIPFTDRVGDNRSSIVVVELPDTFLLDPVWLARAMGYRDDHYIRDHPIEKNMRAIIRNLNGRVLHNGISESTRVNRQYKRRRGL